jgi:exopolysaccharide biosynthesis polyprenyl glycosylphosphotransferase
MGNGTREAIGVIEASDAAVTRTLSSLQLESAMSPSTYAVPHEFVRLTDILTQCVAFFAAWKVAPMFRSTFSTEGLGRYDWVRWLDLQPLGVIGPPALREVFWILLVTVPATLLAMQAFGGYRSLLKQTRARIVLTSFGAPFLGLSLVSVMLVLVRNYAPSRAFLFLFSFLTAAGFLVHRSAMRRYKSRRFHAGHYTRNVVVVAPPAALEWLWAHFARHISPSDRRLFGYLEIPGMASPSFEPSAVPAPFPVPRRLGDVRDLGQLLVHQPIHEVVAVQDAGSEAWLWPVIEQCEYFQSTLRLVPNGLLAFASRDSHLGFRAGPLGLPEVELRPRHLDNEALFVKRALDIVVSATLLVLLAPLFALIAAAIKLTTPKLPVFYPWRVIGYKGRPFTGYKFTTMVADADDRKADLMHLNEMTGPVFKIKNDPRMTPVGRWLRKFSLNELPQLWSVLKGDMSLVGPRPAGPHELVRYELWQKRKLCVQPGITCLWQVRGRNAITSFDDWVRMDFEYIDNWSLWLDVRILIRTAWTVVGGTGS